MEPSEILQNTENVREFMDVLAVWAWPIGLGFMLIVIVVPVLCWALRQKLRHRSYAQEALNNGLRFDQQASLESLDPDLKQMPLFNKGHSKEIIGVCDGDFQGRKVVVFDYAYRVGDGSRTRLHYRQTVLGVKLSHSVPAFIVKKPMHLLERIGEPFLLYRFDRKFDEALGYSQVQEQPSLLWGSHAFFGKNPEAVQAFFNPTICGRLQQDAWRVRMEGHGEWLIFFRRSKLLPPGQLRRWLDNAVLNASLFDNG